MKTTIITIVLSVLVTLLICWFFVKPTIDTNYKEQLVEKDSIIDVQKLIIYETNRTILNDSIQYEKDIENIKKLRDRYPDDVLLDSLLIAGQSIN